MQSAEETFATVPELTEELRRGNMIILVDGEDRENEGDFVVAGGLITVEHVIQMNRLASGIITVPMPRAWLRRLHIDAMVQENAESMSTAFTVTVDARHNISTGSSAQDRVATIRRLADPAAVPEDFVRPGHTNPLAVRDGGVLKRPGHTEASHDLMVLAGLQPVAVLCEIMGDDGTMTRLPGLRALAAQLGLKIGTIADVIRHRRRTEKLVLRTHTEALRTSFGTMQVHRYQSSVDAGRYTALVLGDVCEPCLVRVHTGSLTQDLLDLLGEGASSTLHASLRRMSEEGSGVVVYIESSDAAVDGRTDERNFGIGALVLQDLGVHKLRLITDHPRRLPGIEGFGLEVVEHVPVRQADGAQVLPLQRARP